VFGGVLRGPGGFGVAGVVDGSMTGFQFAALGVESAHCTPPVFRRANCKVVATTPNPYFTLRRKLIDEASSKYFVGQETSPMRRQNRTHWASI
jgi:hypothetical protein